MLSCTYSMLKFHRTFLFCTTNVQKYFYHNRAWNRKWTIHGFSMAVINSVYTELKSSDVSDNRSKFMKTQVKRLNCKSTRRVDGLNSHCMVPGKSQLSHWNYFAAFELVHVQARWLVKRPLSADRIILHHWQKTEAFIVKTVSCQVHQLTGSKQLCFGVAAIQWLPRC